MEASKKPAWKNLPNLITFSRIVIGVPVVWVLLIPAVAGNAQSHVGSSILGIIVILLAIADRLDGYFAKKLDQVTTLGAFLDPLADKLVNLSAYFVLAKIDRIPDWAIPFLVVTFCREFSVTVLRAIVAEEEGKVVSARGLGKVKTVFQAISISGLVLYYPVLWLPTYEIGMIFLVASTLVAVWSGYKYFSDNLAALLK